MKHQFFNGGKGWCEICGNKLFSKGMYCAQCGMTIHQFCIDLCNEPCLENKIYPIVEDYDQNAKKINAHLLSYNRYNWVSYCVVCRKIIPPQFKCCLCSICGIKLHEECISLIRCGCKPLHAVDHWLVKGNCNGMCCVCNKNVGSLFVLKDFKCVCCQKVVHSTCLNKMLPCIPTLTLYNVLSEPLRYPIIIVSSTKVYNQFNINLLNESRQLLSPEQVFDLQYDLENLCLYIKHYQQCVLVISLDNSELNELLNLFSMEKIERKMIITPCGLDNDLSLYCDWNRDLVSFTYKFLSKIPNSFSIDYDIWGTDQLSFMKFLCIGLDGLPPLTFSSVVYNSVKLLTYPFSTSTLTQPLSNILDIQVDNVIVQLPKISILMILNLSTFCGIPLWNVTDDDYIFGFQDSEVNDGIFEVIGFTDISHFTHSLKLLQVPIKITQGSSINFKIKSPLPVYFDSKRVIAQTPFTIQKLTSQRLGIRNNNY
ncbi:hypothetical protein EDI_093690 [Entamoeba dispar SAW760]|uniref:Phorbol-ester/DAG-type domain-containing protein n=1 Tax=Entamoeba dispar (strain ATCC PRA-260 / SAW760) TaxID=370354 RepID=B0EDG1_ENTDS|nr:uncharacterized protein EDI_093690 [Entamoeba dispar SAW760]EDR27578.1 hypothetical protein EDI_093690 [Entamoeba dispar SAW760]|eukprot:EDR27578.1 hypothetical protein EDI_093690 [Entamoeba dispar SAW760]